MSDNVDALKARIEALEQQNAACIATLEESAIRIEALEAALREARLLCDQNLGPTRSSIPDKIADLIDAALAPEQEK